MPRHSHVPLHAKGKSTRLLEVQLGPACEHIRCTLSQHNLDNMPPYVALSYTWNQGSERRHIDCDGLDLEVGDNLWQFLFEFRKRESIRQYHSGQSETNISHLWVDAICIDQSNVHERNDQVAQMRDIYSSAESVIVWLGLVKAQEELVFLLVRHKELLQVRKSQEALIAFLNKPYFTRVWVVQEFILAKVLSIWCGELLLSNATDLDTILREHPETLKAIMRTAAWPLFDYRRKFRYGSLGRKGPSFRLRDLLLSFAALQSTESYDRIYGFLGIASGGPEDSQPIQPDYSKSPADVLVDVLRNECSPQIQPANRNDYELLIFLMQVLKISRSDLARRLWRIDSAVKEHVYVLATFGRTTASLRKLGSVSRIGGFKHVSEFSSHHMRLALFESAASLPDLPSSSIRHLSCLIANPQTVLEFNGAVSRGIMKHSVQSLIQSLSSMEKIDDSSSEGTTSVSRLPEADLGVGDLRQLLYDSLTEVTRASFTAAPLSRQQETRYLHRKYAVFSGTNGIIGVMCDGSCAGRLPKVFDDIYVFADDLESDRALIVDGRNIENLAIVGTAIITKDKGPPAIAQTWQNEVAKVCFHCSLPELLELIRCGVLNECQLQRLVDETFHRESNDEVHLCSVGLSQHPSLRFGA
ncbi:heterokaryon incompatibility protein-domain-containing protein [Phaeosphaeria sp. MPI-PUGE-AT-0046c]|nr:heterokaryon incompatibility protein-domain-containing protein [Phaeosphaeria sp. MPI-PUGE-AT-0046c]